MRNIVHANTAHSDAMAELARLVGHSDPFSAGQEQNPPHEEGVPEAAAAVDPGEEPGAPVEPAVVQAPVDPQTWERIVSQYPSVTFKHEPIPDQWADALDEDGAGAPPLTAVREPVTAPAETGGSRRTLTVLAAVVVLTAGGLGASFLVRPSGSALATTTTTTSTSAPTIMAAVGPAKIQPEPPAAGADAPSEPSTLLDKSNSDGTATAKIVNSAEQPVDLSQAVKPAPLAADDTAPAPARSSAFPEARKVKTVMVRPDGSIVADASPSAASVPPEPATPAAQQASLAFDPKMTLPPPPAPSAPRQPSAVEAAIAATAPPAAGTTGEAAPAPRTPSGKTTARATPRAAASTSQDATAQARTPVATPKSKPPVVHAAKPKAAAAAETSAPVEVASAETTPPVTDATPTSAVGGSFAIQLGAAQSQAEGEAAANRLAQKYGADLGGVKPAVVKAQAGGKTVYRIRVGNLSQDGAKALCTKVQAAGGGCFVAR